VADKPKNPAAVLLGRRRAEKYTPAEISEQAKRSRAKQLEGTTPEERSSTMRKLVEGRWKKEGRQRVRKLIHDLARPGEILNDEPEKGEKGEGNGED